MILPKGGTKVVFEKKSLTALFSFVRYFISFILLTIILPTEVLKTTAAVTLPRTAPAKNPDFILAPPDYSMNPDRGLYFSK